MKWTELHDYLKQYREARTSHKGVGCVEEVNIRTEGGQGIVDTHFQEIKEEIQKREGMVVYVRSLSNLAEVLDQEGEWNGLYRMRTRLFFGEPDKCITMEQAENLMQLGAYLD
ncbi:hypothetical protein M3661_28880 [Paenibacillus sp. MER 180]|uniref:hypothetical protein n=1 Tax=Paenibacillus sp. MER 180 TaxID=2939570 RepID=UPI00203D8AB9|nr:hypothetical protein [Paenibacillus sp. MER 180]MCM3294115.1 hypothetical protein [Paenibacillus sp. MER 180]